MVKEAEEGRTLEEEEDEVEAKEADGEAAAAREWTVVDVDATADLLHISEDAMVVVVGGYGWPRMTSNKVVSQASFLCCVH